MKERKSEKIFDLNIEFRLTALCSITRENTKCRTKKKSESGANICARQPNGNFSEIPKGDFYLVLFFTNFVFKLELFSIGSIQVLIIFNWKHSRSN